MLPQELKNIFPRSRIIYLSLLSLIIVLLGAGLFFRGHRTAAPSQVQIPTGKEWVIVLTENGFQPDQITIRQGDVIKFTTSRQQLFWPASDLHPTHSIYPEFDPKTAINPSDTWSFKFDRVGKWKFHDHLDPGFRGVITVTPIDQQNQIQKLNFNCQDRANKKQCWDESIDTALRTEGISKAFDIVATLYATEPDFQSDCHGYAHKIGEKAYDLFLQNKDLSLSSKSYYCGYGFYHGFMEKMLHATGNWEGARDFCGYVGKQLAKETSDAEGACYHGIGHGSVDGGDPRTWGDAQAMVAPGLELCKHVSSTDFFLYRCVTGAYNAIEILSSDSKYNIGYLRQKPFDFCSTQPPGYQEACYTNMLPIFSMGNNQDFIQDSKIIENITEDNDSYEIRSLVIIGLFHEYIRVNLHNPNYITEGVKICRSLSPRSVTPCIEGLSGGHLKYGEPQKEYEKGLVFCASSTLNLSEKDTCYNFLLSHLQQWYSAEKSQDICKSAPEKYQKYCPIFQS